MRRPLIIMSPKWILRHKLATSSLEELAGGKFLDVIAEKELDADKVTRVVLCSGKVYYHLLEERMARGIDNIALVRIEQLYPFPDIELEEVLKPYTKLKDVIWCQEEPMNQGAWYSSQHHMRHVLAGYRSNAPPALCRSCQLRCTGLWLYVCAPWKNKNNLSMKLSRQRRSQIH